MQARSWSARRPRSCLPASGCRIPRPCWMPSRGSRRSRTCCSPSWAGARRTCPASRSAARSRRAVLRCSRTAGSRRRRSSSTSQGAGGPAGTRTRRSTPAMGSDVLLAVRNLVQEFVLRDFGGAKGGVLQAVSDVSFDLHVGETLGIVGETGSGKSTLARSVIQAPPPKQGQVLFQGQDLVHLKRGALKLARRNLQMVFQDPFTSLDPRWSVASLVEEPLVAYGEGSREQRRARVNELLDLVGLDPVRYGERHTRELSGGQCQRVAVARALALSPKLILCDEPVSSLDVLVQAQVLNLFEKLREDLGLSYLFIAHDLALVKQVSDRVAVMYLGKLCEIGPVRSIFTGPLHPYTLALLNSIPSPDPTQL